MEVMTMLQIEIYIVEEDDNEYDVDVFYYNEDDELEQDEELSKMHFQSLKDAEDYVEKLEEKDGIDYNILEIEDRDRKSFFIDDYDNTFEVGEILYLKKDEEFYLNRDDTELKIFKEGTAIEIMNISRDSAYGNAIVDMDGHKIKVSLDELYIMADA
jgi:hypothetical protein